MERTLKPYGRFVDPEHDLFVGYGTVNNWLVQDAASFMAGLHEHSIDCVTFEFFEAAQPPHFENLAGRCRAFEKYLKYCEEYKIIIYFTFTNSNRGAGKYGDCKIPLYNYDSVIKEAFWKMIDWVKACPYIYVTPSGEAGSQKNTEYYDREIQEMCKQYIPFDRLVDNWTAAPSKAEEGMKYFCQHPSSTKKTVAPDAWIMSDHGLLIRELNVGNELYGECNYGITRDYTQSLLERGFPFIYYDYAQISVQDKAALRALRDARNAVLPPV